VRKRVNARKLIVPIAISVVTIAATAATVATTAVTVASNAGCGDNDGPKVDAAIDSPLI
jgi:hypothetical protein